MRLLTRPIGYVMGLMLLNLCELEAIQKHIASLYASKYVNKDVSDSVKEYMMPDDHPMKDKMDHIFFSSRALADHKSMKVAGFDKAKPQSHTGIIVTRHPDLPLYVIKAYLDESDYHDGKPEHLFWIKRARGARKVQRSITTHHYEHLFKVPKKWIYLLPDEPSPPSDYLRKNFILVEEDMEIYDDKTNENMWGSNRVTTELLDAMYTITTELGLADCAKPDNCPFSFDGRVAFIDTQRLNDRGFVKFDRLTPFLSRPMRDYWNALTKK